MPIKIIDGNLLDATETYLCHQTNCVSHRAAHCAKAVFDRFPFANVYRDRIGSSVPGTIDIKGNGIIQMTIDLTPEQWRLVAEGCRLYGASRIGMSRRWMSNRPGLVGSGCIAEMIGEIGEEIRDLGILIDKEVDNEKIS